MNLYFNKIERRGNCLSTIMAVIILICTVALAAVGIAACSAAQLPTTLQIAEASVRVAYRAAQLVVAHLQQQDLNEEQLKRLDRAEKLLALAAEYLEDLSEEQSRKECGANVGSAIEALQITLEELKADGVEVPPEVAKSLELARALAKR